jgi:two-component system response regulator NreC
MNRTRIVLADDHTLMRAGLRVLLEREPDLAVVGEAEDGRQAIALVESVRPEILVMDIAMPNLNGIEAARQIVERHLHIAVIVLSMHSDESYILRALKVGVRAYLLKDSAESDLIHAIRAVRGGKSFLSPAVGKILLEDYVHQLQERDEVDSYELLTTREREIVQLIAEGKSNKDVASLLNLSPYTVETHRANIFLKLGLHSLPDLVLYAVRKRIVA